MTEQQCPYRTTVFTNESRCGGVVWDAHHEVKCSHSECVSPTRSCIKVVPRGYLTPARIAMANEQCPEGNKYPCIEAD